MFVNLYASLLLFACVLAVVFASLLCVCLFTYLKYWFLIGCLRLFASLLLFGCVVSFVNFAARGVTIRQRQRNVDWYVQLVWHDHPLTGTSASRAIARVAEYARAKR